MRRLIYCLGAVVIITGMYATLYAAVQDVLRSGADDPQIQLAEDGAKQLAQGRAAASLIGNDVDVATSLAPFLIVYDADGHVAASSARLNGATPSLPPGVLHDTTPDHENRLTWQPQPGVRLASIVVAAGQGYVLSGRSLRTVEHRETDVEKIIAAAWAVSLVVLALTFLVARLPYVTRRS